MYCSCARPWPSASIDSLRVSRQRSGMPTARDKRPSTISSGYAEIFAPKPPPTSGVMTRTLLVGSLLLIWSRTPCACWVEIHCHSRPSTHATAEPRTSSGHGATRWFTYLPFTTTSQSAKNSSPEMPGMPSAVVSNTTLLPAAG